MLWNASFLAKGVKHFTKHSFLVNAYIIPESVILDIVCYFYELSVRNVTLFTKLVLFFSRLKFAVLNYNILLDVYFKIFLV